MPRRASSASVVAIDSTWMTKWLRPVLMSTASPLGSWTSSMVTNSSPGSLSIVSKPKGVSGALPTTS
jgi:hypothetical protein